MKIYIKNMVCARCIMVVRNELVKLAISSERIELGEALIEDNLTTEQRKQLGDALFLYGLELMDDSKSMLIEKIKNTVIQVIHHTTEQLHTNFSVFLSAKLGYNYTYMANIFALAQGTSIEHFLITHRIEKVKELLAYGELTLSEIAWQLHYSSVAHLSAQFKKITGQTATRFKQLKFYHRVNLENV
jgi:AraC-like DNA-binding protein